MLLKQFSLASVLLFQYFNTLFCALIGNELWSLLGETQSVPTDAYANSAETGIKESASCVQTFHIKLC